MLFLATPLLMLKAAAAAKPIDLFVDATDSDRCVIRVDEKIPAHGGDFAISLPKWLPGHHQANGTINNVVRFHAYVAGKEVQWTRDPVEMFKVYVHAPRATKEIELKFIVATEPHSSQGAHLGRLHWNQVMFLPNGHIDQIQVTPSVKPPKNWTIYTALVPTSVKPDLTVYNTVNSEELVDSPAELGLYARTYDLGQNHHLDMLTQEPEELQLSDKQVQAAKNLVAETGAIFNNSRHYRQYHFLMTFAPVAGEGTEHHESSEDGTGEGRNGNLPNIGGLISHEMFHSWNGKHRRPAGLITPDFLVPEKTDLLWVYEGLTQYYGEVLNARAGFVEPSVTRNAIAGGVGGMATKPGHLWRPNADTADAASILRAGNTWSRDRRQQDYYVDSLGVWLEADCLIRSKTNNKKSLDDFALAFYGGLGGQPTTIGYERKDVEATLNQVLPYDWHTFFQKRIYEVRDDMAQALSISGWKLAIDDAPAAVEPEGGGPPQGRRGGGGAVTDRNYDLGTSIDREGTVSTVDIDSVAFKAGLFPTDKITKIGNDAFTPAAFKAALDKAAKNTDPLLLTVKRVDVKDPIVLKLDYHGPLLHPHMVRIEGTSDYLGDILKPRRKMVAPTEATKAN